MDSCRFGSGACRFASCSRRRDHPARLLPVAIARTGYTASFETTPIVVNGVTCVTTLMVNSRQAVVAMDGATGREIWRDVYIDKLNHVCCGPVNRGGGADTPVGYPRP